MLVTVTQSSYRMFIFHLIFIFIRHHHHIYSTFTGDLMKNSMIISLVMTSRMMSTVFIIIFFI